MSEEPITSPEVAPPPPPVLWRVVLARLSLALGVLSCLTCVYGILSGIPAILLGGIARRSLPRVGRQAPGVRVAKAGIVLGYVGVAISLISFVILPALSPRVRGPMYRCKNNLKQIGVCLEMYAGENKDTLPDQFGALYPEYLADPEVLVCPESGKKPGDPARLDEWSDYILVPGLHKTRTPADADVIACIEKEYRHSPHRRNELYLDGHIGFRELEKPRQSSKPAQP